MIPNPGLPLSGKQLPSIPPNATSEQQVAVLNDVIDRLNSNQQTVASSTVNIGIDGSADQVFTIPHLLGYQPRAFVYLDGVTLTVGAGTFRKVNIPLPTYLSSNIPGGGGGGSALPISFYSWLDFFTDATNLYIQHRSGDPTLIITLPVTYFLTREAAS